MRNYSISISEVLKQVIILIKQKFYHIFFVFIFNTGIIFFIYRYIGDDLIKVNETDPFDITQGFNQSMIFIYAISLLISLLINTYLTLLVKDTLLNQHVDVTTLFKNTIVNIKYYLFGSILLLFSFFGFILLLSLVIFIPFIKSILFLFLIITFLVFVTYFRFLPTTAVLTQSFSNLYKNTLTLITKNASKSLVLLFLFGFSITILGSLQYDTMLNFLLNNTSYFKMFSIFMIYELINYLSILTDIVFITLLYKHKKNHLH